MPAASEPVKLVKNHYHRDLPLQQRRGDRLKTVARETSQKEVVLMVRNSKLRATNASESVISKSAKSRKVTAVEDDHSDASDVEGEDNSDQSSEGEPIEYLAIATGLDSNCTVDMVEALRQAEENNLNFVCVPLFHPRLRVGSTINIRQK